MKYRVHAIWQRFRYRISARKIAHTYHLVLRRRVLMARVREMQLFYSARAIQRYFKHCMLPFLRAATLIQKMYRGRYAKKRIRILLKVRAFVSLSLSHLPSPISPLSSHSLSSTLVHSLLSRPPGRARGRAHPARRSRHAGARQ